MGVDVFLDYGGGDPDKVGGDIVKISSGNLRFSLWKIKA